MKSNDELEKLFKPIEYAGPVTKKRVDQVIKKVQHEQSTKDLLTLSFGKSFATLMIILGPLFAWIGKHTQNHKEIK